MGGREKVDSLTRPRMRYDFDMRRKLGGWLCLAVVLMMLAGCADGPTVVKTPVPPPPPPQNIVAH
jgi:hypothetical protein